MSSASRRHKRAKFEPEAPKRRGNPALPPARLAKVIRKVQESLSRRAKAKPNEGPSTQPPSTGE